MINPPNIERPSPRRCWWLPSASVVIWLAFFLAISLSPARVMMIASDADPCWHWQQGNWMLQHHAVVRTELFSHTRPGAPLIDLWWLSEIVMALAGNLFGWDGIVLVAAAVCATCVWLLHRQLLGEDNELLLSTALTLLAAAVCATHWVARPHLATQLLVVVFAWQLRWFDRGRATARQLLIPVGQSARGVHRRVCLDRRALDRFGCRLGAGDCGPPVSVAPAVDSADGAGRGLFSGFVAEPPWLEPFRADLPRPA